SLPVIGPARLSTAPASATMEITLLAVSATPLKSATMIGQATTLLPPPVPNKDVRMDVPPAPNASEVLAGKLAPPDSDSRVPNTSARLAGLTVIFVKFPRAALPLNVRPPVF